MNTRALVAVCALAGALSAAGTADAAPSSGVFAWSQNSYAKLRLVGENGTDTIDAVRRGWVTSSGANNGSGFASPRSLNNFFAGECGTDGCEGGGNEIRNWFEFDLTQAVNSGTSITSAELLLDTIPASEKSIYTGFGPVTYTARYAPLAPGGNYSHFAAGTLDATDFANMGSTAVYGSRVYTAADENQNLTSIPLNAAAVTEINTRRHFDFIVVGTVTPLAAPVPTSPAAGLVLLIGACLMIGVFALRARRSA